MQIVNSRLIQTYQIQGSIYIIKVHSPEIAVNSSPGQFCNIKVSESTFPLLRRPFSICDVDGEDISFMFSVYGEGTKMLAHKKTGETLDIIGALGNGFNPHTEYEKAIIVAGGIGAAPFPFLLKRIPSDREVLSFIGGRSEKDVITYGSQNALVSTDDGSLGFKGNVVQLLENNIKLLSDGKIKIFGCGPTPMLRALKEFAVKYNFDCEISTESVMACGFGICQGCPIEAVDKDGYYLICKDGPVFDARKVIV